MHPEPIPPQPGQESVWEYPRPPRLEACSRHIQVFFNEVQVAETHRAYRVLETSHPPVYYIPPEDVRMRYLHPAPGSSVCEWKGWAVYYTVKVGKRRARRAAWSYPQPTPPYTAITGYLAFYAGQMDRCLVDGEQVTPQPGDFYGGWITKDVVGPYKGE